MGEEKWLPVADYEGYYEVSSLGNVRSVDRMVKTSHGRTWSKPGQGLTVSVIPTRKGTYRRVQLSRDGKCRPYYVYVLVARAFLNDRPPDSQVRHGPNGQLDDGVDNLCYGTPAENQQDRVRDGTDNSQAKLNEIIVLQCRARREAGESFAALGREFGVSRQGMRRAVMKGWAHA